MDPDVFVWDSMMRLTNYTAGKYATEDVLHHTILAIGADTVGLYRSTCTSRRAVPRHRDDPERFV
jgi:hypothetical protein